MRPLILAAVISLATSPAFAFCALLPDGPSTGYVSNQTALVLCQQRELAEAMAQRARQLKFEAAMRALQLELEQQLKLQRQLAQAMAPIVLPQI